MPSWRKSPPLNPATKDFEPFRRSSSLEESTRAKNHSRSSSLNPTTRDFEPSKLSSLNHSRSSSLYPSTRGPHSFNRPTWNRSSSSPLNPITRELKLFKHSNRDHSRSSSLNPTPRDFESHRGSSWNFETLNRNTRILDENRLLLLPFATEDPDPFKPWRFKTLKWGTNQSRKNLSLPEWKTPNFHEIARVENEIAIRENNPTAHSRPLVLLVSLKKSNNFESKYSRLLSGLRERADVVQATSVVAFIQYLSGRRTITAIIITDEALAPLFVEGYMQPRHDFVNSQLRLYAVSGGTVIMACELALHGLTLSFNTYIKMVWRVDWMFATRNHTFFGPSRYVLGRGQACLSMDMYTMDAVCLSNLQPRDIIISHSNGSPALLEHYGRGFIGWLGDVNVEQGSVEVLIAMCNLSGMPVNQRGRQISEHG